MTHFYVLLADSRRIDFTTIFVYAHQDVLNTSNLRTYVKNSNILVIYVYKYIFLNRQVDFIDFE